MIHSSSLRYTYSHPFILHPSRLGKTTTIAVLSEKQQGRFVCFALARNSLPSSSKTCLVTSILLRRHVFARRVIFSEDPFLALTLCHFVTTTMLLLLIVVDITSIMDKGPFYIDYECIWTITTCWIQPLYSTNMKKNHQYTTCCKSLTMKMSTVCSTVGFSTMMVSVCGCGVDGVWPWSRRRRRRRHLEATPWLGCHYNYSTATTATTTIILCIH